ncbi:hypothetical protein LXL04_021198 [Taraxacum kok-saghyz]
MAYFPRFDYNSGGFLEGGRRIRDLGVEVAIDNQLLMFAQVCFWFQFFQSFSSSLSLIVDSWLRLMLLGRDSEFRTKAFRRALGVLGVIGRCAGGVRGMPRISVRHFVEHLVCSTHTEEQTSIDPNTLVDILIKSIDDRQVTNDWRIISRSHIDISQSCKMEGGIELY